MTRAIVIAIIASCSAAVCEREAPAARQESPSEVSYVLVRSDLPEGVQLAQTGHAAQEALGYPPVIMVVLAVPDAAALQRYADAFAAAGIAHAPIVEDAGPFAQQLVSIGVKPTTDRNAIRRVVSSLPIAGKKVLRPDSARPQGQGGLG